MRDEMGLMARKKVVELIDPLPQCKSIEKTWVFKIKRRKDGLINKFRPCYS